VKRILLIAATAAALAFVLLYAGDYISLRYRIPRNRQQYGSVRVRRYYAVPMKNRTTEYMFDQPFSERCVHSIFSHFGDPPCWYLARHQRQEVKVGGAVPDF
jgi:hypothetical protein